MYYIRSKTISYLSEMRTIRAARSPRTNDSTFLKLSNVLSCKPTPSFQFSNPKHRLLPAIYPLLRLFTKKWLLSGSAATTSVAPPAVDQHSPTTNLSIGQTMTSRDPIMQVINSAPIRGAHLDKTKLNFR